MRYWRLLAFSRYTQSETASAMKARDWKDVTDIVERERETVWKQQYEGLRRLNVKDFRVFLTDGLTSASGLTVKERSTKNQTHRDTKHLGTVLPHLSGNGWLKEWWQYMTGPVQWAVCLTASEVFRSCMNGVAARLSGHRK